MAALSGLYAARRYAVANRRERPRCPIVVGRNRCLCHVEPPVSWPRRPAAAAVQPPSISALNAVLERGTKGLMERSGRSWPSRTGRLPALKRRLMGGAPTEVVGPRQISNAGIESRLNLRRMGGRGSLLLRAPIRLHGKRIIH